MPEAHTSSQRTDIPTVICRTPHRRNPRSFGLLGVAVGMVLVLGVSTRDASGQAGSVRATLAPTVPDTTRRLPRDWSFSDSRVTFGSASQVSPATVVVNRFFSTMVYVDTEARLGRVDWGGGWASVRDALVHPGAAVDRAGGVLGWLRHEFGPDSFEVWRWAWASNYAGHILGGGITYRIMKDWFAEQGLPLPGLTAAVFTWGGSVVNEVLENQAHPYGMASTVADVYIFEPLGIFLFSFDGVARFAATTLHAADWSPQASISIPTGTVRNNDQVMSYKLGLPFTDRARILLLVGQQSSSGVQVKLRDGLWLGAALGFAAQRQVVDPVTSAERLETRPQGGLYLSRDNSLLVSGTASLGEKVLTLNVYPSIMPHPLNRFGAWVGLERGGTWSIGLTSGFTLGLGVGWDIDPRRSGS